MQNMNGAFSAEFFVGHPEDNFNGKHANKFQITNTKS
jgi:hypothetical protein